MDCSIPTKITGLSQFQLPYIYHYHYYYRRWKSSRAIRIDTEPKIAPNGCSTKTGFKDQLSSVGILKISRITTSQWYFPPRAWSCSSHVVSPYFSRGWLTGSMVTWGNLMMCINKEVIRGCCCKEARNLETWTPKNTRLHVAVALIFYHSLQKCINV